MSGASTRLTLIVLPARYELLESRAGSDDDA